MKVARELAGNRPTSEGALEVRRVAATHGAVLHPVHPGESDPTLMRHFQAEVADARTAQLFAAELLGCRAVEAAYVKPGEEPPLGG